MSKICSLLWSHISLQMNGAAIPCCRVFEFETIEGKREMPSITDGLENVLNSEYFDSYRNHMIENDDLPDPVCKRCTLEENAGYESYRTKWNKRFDPYVGQEPKIRFLETSFSTHCNLACRMCSERYSSKWQLINNPKLKPELLQEPSNMNHYREADLSELEYVKVLGGEPFLSKNHNEFLEIISEQAKVENVELQYHTNGTIFPNKNIIDFWKRCKSVFVCFSIDHIGEKNDWLRPGSSWKNLETVVEKFKELEKEIPHLRLGNNTVVSALNVWNLDVIVHWLSQNVGFNEETSYFDILRYPNHLSISNLTDEIKEKLILNLDSQMERIIAAAPNREKDIRNFFKGVKFRLSETPNERYTYDDIAQKEQKLDKYFDQDMKEIYPEVC